PGKAWGIVQWTGVRITNLENFAQKNNLNIDDFATQLQFEWQELNSSPYDQTVLAPLKQTTTPADAATVVFNNYEIAGDNSLGARQGNAQKLFDEYGSSTGTDVNTPISPASSCSSTGPGQDTQYI